MEIREQRNAYLTSVVINRGIIMDRDFRLKERREGVLDLEILVRILRQTAGEEEAAKVYGFWFCCING